MSAKAIVPGREPEEIQEFLYACAFWAVAADEQLRTGEQAWLANQFGQERSDQLLESFTSLAPGRFHELFGEMAKSISDDDKRRIYPGLVSWLVECFTSDGDSGTQEESVLAEIQQALDIEGELARLAQSPSSGPSAEAIDGPASAAPAVRELTGHMGEVNCVCAPADGGMFASGGDAGTVRVWNAVDGSETMVLEGHETGVTAVAYGPDGKTIYSGDRSGVVNAWNTGSGERAWTVPAAKRGGITGLCVSPDGKMVVTTSEVGVISVLDADVGEELRSFGIKHGGALHGVAFSPGGKAIAVAGDDKTVRLWEPVAGSELSCLQGHSDGVLCVAFGSDCNGLVSGGRDNTVRLWDTVAGKEAQCLEGHTFSVYGVALGPGGFTVLSCSWDHTIRLWDADAGRETWQKEAHASRFSDVVLLGDTGLAVAAGSDHSVYYLENLAR